VLQATFDQVMSRSKNATIVEPKSLVNQPQTHFAKLRLGPYQYEHNGHYVTSLDQVDVSQVIKAMVPE